MKVFLNIIRWTARIIGILPLIIILPIFISHMIAGLKGDELGIDTYEAITFVFVGIGFAALILAWLKEGLGGIIALISFIVFNILAAMSPSGGAHYSSMLLIPLVPSILFLLYWLLKRKMLKR